MFCKISQQFSEKADVFYEVKKIYCEHLDMEAESDMEKYLIQAENLEAIRNEDAIFIKHGFKAIDIKRQVKHYDLENNPEVW